MKEKKFKMHYFKGRGKRTYDNIKLSIPEN